MQNIDLTEDDCINIKKFLTNADGSVNKIRLQNRCIKANMPDIHDKIKGEYLPEILYRVFYDIPLKKKLLCKGCKNKEVLFKKFSQGYRTFCSNKCIALWQSTDKEFSDKISNTIKLNTNKNYFIDKYGIDCSFKGNDFFIYSYKNCEHTPFKINKTQFHKRIKKGKCLCDKCLDNTINKLNVNFDINRENLKTILGSESKNGLTELKLKVYYSEVLKSINEWCSLYGFRDLSLSKRKYIFLNKIEKYPLCKICNNNPVNFNKTNSIFNETCESRNCRNGYSKGEIEVRDYIESIYKGRINKFWIEKNEIDIYLPELQIGFEYNGLYWHSEDKKDKFYHINKLNIAEKNGIKLMFIWEDDWDDVNKKEIIKSIIRNKLGLNSNKIYARKCVIKSISSNIYNDFLESNHIQGRCNSSLRYGLFYNEDLVSVIGLGKKRNFMNSKSEGALEFELIRFCNKLNTSIIGGASKLFNHFINEIKPTEVISYANRDFSNGRIYEVLGFQFIENSGPGYYWTYKKKKYHRSNFMKHKLVKEGFDSSLTEEQIMINRGYSRIWNTGNKKYLWK